MERPATGVSGERESVRLSPCVCSTLRMVSRAVTRLYDDILRRSGLRVTQFSILATIAQAARRTSDNLRRRWPSTRRKAVRLTRKGRRTLDVARPLWAQAQTKVLRELGTTAWHDAERRLARLLHVAVEKRRLGRGAMRSVRRSPRRPSRS